MAGPVCQDLLGRLLTYTSGLFIHRPDGKTEAQGWWPSGQGGPEPCPPLPALCVQGGRGHRASGGTCDGTSPSPGPALLSSACPPCLSWPGGAEGSPPSSPARMRVYFLGELRCLPQLHTHAAFPDGARRQSAQPRSLAWLLLPPSPGRQAPAWAGPSGLRPPAPSALRPAAPEVLGPEKYDKSCDMWSLGVIMYIL